MTAREFIAQTIRDHADANGEVPAKLVMQLAMEAGYKAATISVARSSGGFRTRKVGKLNVWSMPADTERADEGQPSLFDAQDQTQAPVDQMDVWQLHDRVRRLEVAFLTYVMHQRAVPDMEKVQNAILDIDHMRTELAQDVMGK
ncbi:hypothetical protein [Nocardia cyriacigeorgica]|uniref:hypothetical protein n=1 Tax=Nocardia cyriacigeorgica TaxID=135487 RepID=UPI0013CF4C74|nr:hypothetical protein [Nocardia cyriacigeorgica]NEW29476.1 hypothetical protein [Nocardia cyriacigeorgica]